MSEVRITSEGPRAKPCPLEAQLGSPGSSVLFCKGSDSEGGGQVFVWNRSLLREAGWMQEEELTVVVNLGLSHPHHKPLTMTIFLLISFSDKEAYSC